MGQFKGRATTKKKQSPTVEVHSSLKQEVFQNYISLYIGSRDFGCLNPTHFVQASSSFIFSYYCFVHRFYSLRKDYKINSMSAMLQKKHWVIDLLSFTTQMKLLCLRQLLSVFIFKFSFFNVQEIFNRLLASL